MQRISQLEFSYQKICLDFLLKTFVFVIFFFFYWLKFDNATGIFFPNFHHIDQKLSCWTIPRVKMCFISVRWFVFGECFLFFVWIFTPIPAILWFLRLVKKIMFFINKMHIEYVILKCYVIHCIILQCQNDVKIHKRLNILDIVGNLC